MTSASGYGFQKKKKTTVGVVFLNQSENWKVDCKCSGDGEVVRTMTNLPRQVSRRQEHKTRHLDHHSLLTWESLGLRQRDIHARAFSAEWIWEIRWKFERGDNIPQSNNLHYSFLSFSGGWTGIGSDIFPPFVSFSPHWSDIILSLTPILNGSALYPPWKTQTG